MPAPFKPNAVRIRTGDGRFLRAINGPTSYYGYLGPTSETPGAWDTFLIEEPETWPLRSGDRIVLRAVDDTWRPLTDDVISYGLHILRGPVYVRVDHGVLKLPKKHRRDPQLVTYQFGGPDVPLAVSSPFSPGYPAYTGDDPNEWTFTITKIEGGSPAAAGTPINTGDGVTFSFLSENPAQPERSWRLRDDTNPPRVDGDAAPGGPTATVFTVELNEVQPDLGWRPPVDAPCRQCARVTAVVRRRDSGDPIADAHVIALAPSVPFAGDTPPAHTPPARPSDGRAGLTATVDDAVRDCVPAGPITLQATANRFQTATVTAQVPGQGAVDVPIPMDCTVVTGRVLDSAGSPMPGEWVFLTDRQGNPLLDPNGNPYQTKTDLNGRFQFACVPHGEIKLSTDRDPSADRIVTIGPTGANIELVVQLTSATVIVRVVDADNNDQPLDGANVRLTTSDGVVRTSTTSGAPPQAAFAAVTPAGAATVRATMTGYLPNTVPATIPASGTVTITVRLRRDVAVQTPTAFVMQLDWGATPRDLDLHCSGPDNAGGRFHCLFSNMQPVPYVRLDVDDRDATGPERITVTQVAGAFVAGDYHCWVHNFSGEQTFANSGASVTLLSLDATSVPTQRGRWVVADVPGTPDRLWNVMRFTIDAQGQLTVTTVMAYQPGNAGTVL
ncbi:carboxypeptidase-like regulatory domain-containing protein [Pseudonocardia kujensis]|uniref:carboxypeptidase regulatory-like domain-containing protein n=1 Tax=Pseudonocardia kujensis TaxID=1128675 RepID=UPI001E5929A1|nr:carboxypeptidase-like regulatory domain-containing protein [Pseudonocardia kujensis]MCE0764772.1 carboxypeptidase-like regulatory domain-containing protein [Pseudonocardia kujensis]